MSYVDIQYINMISPRLKMFSWKTSTLATCRCPLCGDSKKNEHKRRFYFYFKKGEYHVKCHNCDHAGLFSTFLKYYDPELYREYRMQIFQDTYAPKKDITPLSTSPKEKFNKSLKIDLPRISDLPQDHKAVTYLTSRKIPTTMYNEIYYCERFEEFAQNINPGRNYFDDPKIVIPFKLKEGDVYGFICRTLNPYSSLRYIILKSDEDDRELIYGIDKIDTSKMVYILEGPIDSMMIPNAIAVSGLKVMKESSLPCDKENCVFVYDNEPRNKYVVEKMDRAVEAGYSVCIWPDDISQKDVNEMIVSGINAKEIIDQNIYSGLMAKIKIQQWRKV